MKKKMYKLKEIESQEEKTIKCFITGDEDEQNVYGILKLENIDFVNLSARLNIEKINLSFQMGISTIEKMLYHAFYNLSLWRIYGVIPEIQKDIAYMYEAAGFKFEGIKRGAIREENKFLNESVYSILQNEYDCKHAKYQLNLSDYCIKSVFDLEEKRVIMKTCEDAFENHIPLDITNDKLIRKIDALAEFFVAYSTEVLGYAAVYANDIESKIAFITLIAVRPRFQKRNIGYRLLKKCQEIAVKRGCRGIKLEVNNKNHSAIAFYEKNGFRYFSDCTKDSIYMYLEL